MEGNIGNTTGNIGYTMGNNGNTMGNNIFMQGLSAVLIIYI